jgi:uncharacterized membrane protein YhhN
MRTVWIALLLLAPLLAALAIRAEHTGARGQLYLFKPLATFCILLIALLSPPPYRPGYHISISLGLLFSLIGDVFLMLPRERFLAGLFSFLVALACYCAAFFKVAGFPTSVPVAIVLLAYGVFLLNRLWPHLAEHRVPVIVYSAVLLLMCAGAFNQLSREPAPRTWLAAAGAALFVISDSLLALDRFAASSRNRQTLVLTTYYAAQWLIAVSVRREAWWAS